MSCDYMWKVLFQPGGIPLLYCRDPALPGRNFLMLLFQPALAKSHNNLKHAYQRKLKGNVNKFKDTEMKLDFLM